MGCGASQDAEPVRDSSKDPRKQRRPVASEQDMLRNADAVREKYARERDQEDEAVLRHLEESRSLPGSRAVSIRGSAANSQAGSPVAFPLGGGLGDRGANNLSGVGGLRPSFDIGDEDDEGIGTVLSGAASRAGSRRSMRSGRSNRSSFYGGPSPSLHGQSSLSVFDLIESDGDNDDANAGGDSDPHTATGLDRAALRQTTAGDSSTNVETWVQAQACTSDEGNALLLPAPLVVADDVVSSGLQSTSPTPRPGAQHGGASGPQTAAGIGPVGSPNAEDPPHGFPHVPSGSIVVGPIRSVSLASSAQGSPMPAYGGGGRAGGPLHPLSPSDSEGDIAAAGSFGQKGLGGRRHGGSDSGGASRSATPLETMQSKLLPNGFAMGGTSRRPRHA